MSMAGHDPDTQEHDHIVMDILCDLL